MTEDKVEGKSSTSTRGGAIMVRGGQTRWEASAGVEEENGIDIETMPEGEGGPTEMINAPKNVRGMEGRGSYPSERRPGRNEEGEGEVKEKRGLPEEGKTEEGVSSTSTQKRKKKMTVRGWKRRAMGIARSDESSTEFEKIEDTYESGNKRRGAAMEEEDIPNNSKQLRITYENQCEESTAATAW